MPVQGNGIIGCVVKLSAEVSLPVSSHNKRIEE